MSHKVLGFPENVQKCIMHPYSWNFFLLEHATVGTRVLRVILVPAI